MITVNVDQISDSSVKQALESLVDQLNKNAILGGDWDFVRVEFLKTGGTKSVFHRLKATPVDIIILSVPSGANLAITNKTKESITVTSAVPGEIRILLGKIQRG